MIAFQLLFNPNWLQAKRESTWNELLSTVGNSNLFSSTFPTWHNLSGKQDHTTSSDENPWKRFSWLEWHAISGSKEGAEGLLRRRESQMPKLKGIQNQTQRWWSSSPGSMPILITVQGFLCFPAQQTSVQNRSSLFLQMVGAASYHCNTLQCLASDFWTHKQPSWC